jgi:hypothetical protein
MTPNPSKEDMAARHVYDPAPGTVHVLDFVAQAKDGVYAKDILSDYVIGILLVARAQGDIAAWEGTLFQIPFVKGMKLRSGLHHYGHAFTDPDGNLLTLSGRSLSGSSRGHASESDLDIEGLRKHPAFQAWIQSNLYAGRTKAGTAYVRVTDHSTLKACDKHTNSLAYTPGPDSIPQAQASDPLREPKKAPTKSSNASRPKKSKPKALSDEHVSREEGSNGGGGNDAEGSEGEAPA